MEKAIVPQCPGEIPSSDSKQDEIIFYLPSHSSVWKHVCYLLYLQILLHIPHHSSDPFRRFSLNTALALGSKKCRTTA